MTGSMPEDLRCRENKSFNKAILELSQALATGVHLILFSSCDAPVAAAKAALRERQIIKLTTCFRLRETEMRLW